MTAVMQLAGINIPEHLHDRSALSKGFNNLSRLRLISYRNELPMILSRLKSSTESLLHLFYPRLCAYCDRSLGRDEKTLCLHCIFRLPRTGFHNHPDNRTASIFMGRVPIEHATSFVLFTKDGMVQALLHVEV